VITNRSGRRVNEKEKDEEEVIEELVGWSRYRCRRVVLNRYLDGQECKRCGDGEEKCGQLEV